MRTAGDVQAGADIPDVVKRHEKSDAVAEDERRKPAEPAIGAISPVILSSPMIRMRAIPVGLMQGSTQFRWGSCRSDVEWSARLAVAE
jgi:hypothetical protein